MKLETFKTYFKINLVNSFIQFFKSSIKTLILFIKKLNNSNYLYIYYYGLNNLTIKNLYLLPLINKLFN